MDISFFSPMALALLLAASMILLVSRSWRWIIGALGVLYLGMFVLVAQSWPSDLAVVKLVTGWMAGSILGMTRINLASSVQAEASWPTQSIFRILAGILVIASVASLSSVVLQWVPGMEPNQAWGGLLLVGMGLLHLGFSGKIFRVVLSLLTLLAGFEIIYAVVEASTLVAGLLAVINLGIALAGAYLMILPTIEEPTA